MKPFFVHSTTKSGKRFTVAAYENGKNELRIGVAVCSNKDQFCKRTGRNKALGRAKANNVIYSLDDFILWFQHDWLYFREHKEWNGVKSMAYAIRYYDTKKQPDFIVDSLIDFANKFALKN